MELAKKKNATTIEKNGFFRLMVEVCTILTRCASYGSVCQESVIYELYTALFLNKEDTDVREKVSFEKYFFVAANSMLALDRDTALSTKMTKIFN